LLPLVAKARTEKFVAVTAVTVTATLLDAVTWHCTADGATANAVPNVTVPVIEEVPDRIVTVPVLICGVIPNSNE